MINSQLASVSNTFTNISFAFNNFSFREFVDIGIVSLIIYIVVLFIIQSRSYFIVTISAILAFISFFSQNLNLSLTRTILQPLSTLAFIIVAIVFQREIRKFFKWIITGQKDWFSVTKHISKSASTEISDAIMYMSKYKIGGIFVFVGKQDLEDIIEGGQDLDGKITKEILLSIFDKNSSGHDGAVIIDDDMIKKFGVHLPLAKDFSNFRKVGTRHRASAGITEDTDAVAVAISEERGSITYFEQGKAISISDENALNSQLKKLTGELESKHTNFWHYFFIKNFWPKLISITLATTLWTIMFVQTGIIKKEYTVPLSFQLLSNGFEIDSQTARKQVNVVLQGKSRDINQIDPAKLEIRIDAKDFAIGTKEIEIKKEMLNVPSFITVSEIDPESISINLKAKEITPVDNSVVEKSSIPEEKNN
jgi:diadenylate cyclase